jgi:hypothetical protein
MVKKFSPTDLQQIDSFSGYSGWGLVVSETGDIYVTDCPLHGYNPPTGNNRVVKLNSAYSYITQFGSSYGSDNAHLYNPGVLDRDNSGNIYVEDSGNDRLMKLNSNLTYLSQYILTDISAVTVSDSYVYAASYGGQIIKLNLSLTETGTSIDINSYGVHDLAVNNSGYIYAATNSEIVKLDSDLNVVGRYTSSPWFQSVMGIDIDSSNNIYIANYYEGVAKLSDGSIISIDSGASFTNATSVSLTLTCEDGSGSGCAEMQFSNNGTDWSTTEAYAATKAWTLDPGDGTKTVYGRFKDTAGNWTDVYSDIIVLDMAAPATNASPAGGLYVGTQSVELACDDGGGSGCDTTYYCLGTGCNPTIPYTAAIDVTPTEELRFYSTDMVGNMETVKTEVYAQPYTLNITAQGTGLGNVTSAPAGISCGDGPGNDCTEDYADGTEVTLTAVPHTSSAFTGWSGGGCTGAGQCAVAMIANTSVTATFELDTVAPTGSITINEGAGFTNSTSVTLFLTCDDGGGSGCNEMQFSNDGTNWSAPTAFSSTAPWTLLPGNGGKSVHARFKDSAGNWSEIYNDNIVLNANSVAGIVIIDDGTAFTNSTSVTLTLECDTGGGSACAEMQFSNDNSNWSMPTAYSNTTSWSVSTGDGIKTVYAKFSNTADKWSEACSDTIVLDTTASFTTASPTGGVYNTPQSVTLTCVDGAGSGCNTTYYCLGTDCSPTNLYGGSIDITAPTDLSFYSTDLAGNSEAIMTETYVIDESPPFTIANPAGSVYNIPQSVTLVCDDGGGSGCDKIYYCTGAGCNPTTIYDGAVGISKPTDLRFYSTDLLGHSESVKSESYIIDTPAWTKQAGTTLTDEARGVAVDGSGNVFISGMTRGGLDGNTNAGGQDLFLIKYDADGTRLWTRQVGTSAEDASNAVAVDDTGNAYMAAWSSGGIDGNSNAGGTDIVVMKYDTNGTKLWTKQMGGSLADYPQDIAIHNGNAYIVGYTYGSVDGYPNAGSYDLFIIKYDTNGNKLWSKQMGTSDGSCPSASSGDYAFGVAVDGVGNAYVAGRTNNSFDGNTWQGCEDPILIKFDANGNKLWSRQMGTADNDAAHDVAVDSSGNAYLVGWTNGDLDGNTSSGSGDIFITKYAPNGDKLWTKQMGTADGEKANGVTVDSLDNVYMTGTTYGGLDGFLPAGSSDVFLIKYAPNGTKLWTTQIGSSVNDSNDYGGGVAVDSSGNTYLAGWTGGNLDGNTNIGSYDYFLMKFGSSTDTTPPITNATPAGGIYTDTQSVTLTCDDGGGMGCDVNGTYYCLGAECNPTTLYGGAIDISSITDLRFYSTDQDGDVYDYPAIHPHDEYGRHGPWQRG